MKRVKRNRKSGFLFLGLLLIAGLWWVYQKSWKGEDLAIVEIGTDGLTMVNISPKRGMVNTVLVSGAVDLWIPGGMGWYRAEKLPLILEQEKDKKNLAQLVTFFNFGFWPKEVVLGESWRQESWLWQKLGPLGWLRFRYFSDEWLWKKEAINRQLVSESENLSEIMPRDMADSEVINKNLRMTVINASGKNGFANFVSDRLNWWGMMVTSVITSDLENNCRISYSEKLRQEGKIAKKLADIFNCRVTETDGEEMELVLGEETGRMVKYSETYVRSF